MSPVPAFAFLLAASFKNRLVAQARRLRKPRYLIGTVIGVGYLWVASSPRMFGISRHGQAGEELRQTVELVLVGLALMAIAGNWIFGSDRGAVRFSEAEVQLLFPAPLTRTQLLHYKLVHTLLLSLLSAVLTAVIFGRGFFGHPFYWAIGSWIGFATLSFHGIAASFARSTLFEHGLSGLKRYAVTFTVLGAFAAVVVHGLRAAGGDIPRAVELAPLSWLLLPFRAPAKLMVAGDFGSFARQLPIALGFLGFHYAWVMSSAVRFEDASLEAAEKRAKWLEARRGMRGAIVLPVRTPFSIAPIGAPEIGLLWKGIIAGLRKFPIVEVTVIAVCMVAGMVATAFAGSGSGYRAIAAGLAGMGWVLSVAYGPLIARFDLRLDVQNLEQLRALPLSGRQIFLGEVLAPAALLAIAQWAFLALTVLLGGVPEIPGGTSARVAAIAGAAIAGPALSLLGVAIQNAVVIVFPDWNRTPIERSRGPELIGMQLMILMANFVALAVLVLPGAALGAGLMYLAWDRMGVTSAPIAAVLIAFTTFGEVVILSAVFGRIFDRLEVTS